MGKQKEPMCWFWFHCAYIEKEIRVTKKEIDKAVGDKLHKIFLPEFSIVAHFEELGEASLISPPSSNNNNNNNNNNNHSAEEHTKSEQSEETDTEEEEESDSEKEITKMVKQSVVQMEEDDHKNNHHSEEEEEDTDEEEEGTKNKRDKHEKKSSLITINLPLFKKRPSHSHPKKSSSKSNKKDLKNEDE